MTLYQVIYDVREESDPTTLLIALALVAIGVALWGTGRLNERLWIGASATRAGEIPGAQPSPLHRAGRMRRWGRSLTLVALLLGGSWTWMDHSQTKRMRDALETGDYTVVEGHVREFERGDRGGHQEERFTIVSDGRRYTYEYTSSRRQPGFHESHGPVREGLFVRIADVDGYIARLEIGR